MKKCRRKNAAIVGAPPQAVIDDIYDNNDNTNNTNDECIVNSPMRNKQYEERTKGCVTTCRANGDAHPVFPNDEIHKKNAEIKKRAIHRMWDAGYALDVITSFYKKKDCLDSSQDKHLYACEKAYIQSVIDEYVDNNKNTNTK